jgi:hypothetical protein
MSTIRFAECILHVDHADQYLETAFRDGTVAPARPNHRPEDIQRAHELGYAGDCWAMVLDHEPIHTFVGEIFGFGHSVILWNVAHGGEKRWPEWGKEEEGYTTSLQTFVRTRVCDDLVLGLFKQAYERLGLYPNQVEWMVRGLLAEVHQGGLNGSC